MRIISTGELQYLLNKFTQNPNEGDGFHYTRLPQSLGRGDWLALDDDSRRYYEPDPESMTVTSTLPQADGAVSLEGIYTRFVLPNGSYDAWVVNRRHDEAPFVIARETLFEVPGVKAALWLLLGGGLDDKGKEKWLSMRLDEGMTAEAIFADALAQIS